MVAVELVPTGGCSRLRLTPGLSPSEAGTGRVAAVAVISLPSWKDPKVYNHMSIPISPYLINQGSRLTSPARRSRGAAPIAGRWLRSTGL